MVCSLHFCLCGVVAVAKMPSVGAYFEKIALHVTTKKPVHAPAFYLVFRMGKLHGVDLLH